MAFLFPTTLRTARWPLPRVPKRSSPRVKLSSVASKQSMCRDAALIDNVLEHWYGFSHISRFDTLAEKQNLWYKGTKETDEDIRDRFGSHVARALEGKLDHFIGSEEFPVKADLALVVLLDQYPRNIYRGTAKAFAGDSMSRQIVMGVLEPDRWVAAKTLLPPIVQASLLLPLMHQESITDVELCAAKVEDLAQDCRNAGEEGRSCAEVLEDMKAFVENHKNILEKFGRYPYRNAVLGREDTTAETEFLQDGPRFGQ